MVEEARSFAEKAHEGQFRKGTKRPYIVHPLEVAKIVSPACSLQVYREARLH